MTAEEEAAAAEVRDKTTKAKLNCYDMLRGFVREPETMKYAGVKSLEEACRVFIGSTEKECERLVRDFERRFPD